MIKTDELLASATILVLIIIVTILLIAPEVNPNPNYSVASPEHVKTLLNNIQQTFHVPYYGIIHIGARHAEELEIYKHFKIKDILWIEADPTAEQRLRKVINNSPGSKLAFFAATDKNGTIDLYRTTNEGHSSSIFKLKNHLLMSPDVKEDQIITVSQKRLDDYLKENADLKNIRYNIIVIDIQGAELVALTGAIQTLKDIDAIIAEINYDELYAGAVIVRELDNFLIKHNFVRVDSISVNRAYGNSLYVKNKFFGFKPK